jgi:hypothetical protein
MARRPKRRAAITKLDHAVAALAASGIELEMDVSGSCQPAELEQQLIARHGT